MRDGSRASGRHHSRQAVETSLRRLQTDRIDLYQIHWPSRGHYNFVTVPGTYAPHTQDTRETPLGNIEDMLEGLDAMVKAGKIGHCRRLQRNDLGHFEQWLLVLPSGLPRLVSVQNEYSPAAGRQFDLDMAELSHHDQVGLLAYSPLAGGMLTGKYQNGAMPKGSRGATTRRALLAL